MKFAMLCLLVISFACSSYAQNRKSVDLRSELEILNEINCRDLDLGLILKLTYTNVGERNGIVFNKPPLIISTEVSQIFSENVEKRVMTSRSMFSISDYDGVFDAPDGKYFTVLKPHEKLEIRNVPFSVSLFNPKHGLGLKDGSYVVRFNFLTFPFTDNPATFKWFEYGFLWSSNLNLELPLTVNAENLKRKSIKDWEECRAKFEALMN